MCQILIERFYDGFSGNQTLNFHLRCAVCGFADQLSYHVVTAGVDPIGFGLCTFRRAQRIAVIDNIPRTVNILIAKTIAVIPFAGFVQMALKPVVFQHLSNFVICKSKVFIEIRIGNGVYGHIVQAGEDALLGYTQAAGQHGKKQAVIGFQCRSKHSADQVDHALIVTMLIGFV